MTSCSLGVSQFLLFPLSLLLPVAFLPLPFSLALQLLFPCAPLLLYEVVLLLLFSFFFLSVLFLLLCFLLFFFFFFLFLFFFFVLFLCFLVFLLFLFVVFFLLVLRPPFSVIRFFIPPLSARCNALTAWPTTKISR